MKAAGAQGPTKAFEVSWANQLWMTDGMWGPSLPIEEGGKPIRTHLLALIDDCSRLCPHGQYYPGEKIECFLDLFKHALRSRGIPEKLYTDNGGTIQKRPSAQCVCQLRYPSDPCQALSRLEQRQNRALLQNRSKRLRAKPGV